MRSTLVGNYAIRIQLPVDFVRVLVLINDKPWEDTALGYDCARGR